MSTLEYTPSPQVIAWAKCHGYNVDAHLEFFQDYISYKTGKPYRNLDAAFRNCMRSDWGSIRAQMLKAGTYWPKKQETKPINGMVWDTEKKGWVKA